MANMLIMRPLSGAVAIAVTGGAGVANIVSSDPKEVWTGVANSGGKIGLILDFGAPVVFDGVFLGALNCPPGSLVECQGGIATSNEFFVLSASPVPPRPTPTATVNCAWPLPAPVRSRYLRLTITVGAAGASASLGVLAAAITFRPEWNREWGGGRQLLDMSSAEALPGGGFGIDRQARKAGYQWTFGDLSAADLDELWELCLDRGESAPLVVVEDPDLPVGNLISIANLNAGALVARALTRLGGVADSYDAGAASADGYDGGCVVSFMTPTADKRFTIGLSQSPVGTTVGAVEIGLEINAGTVRLLAGGALIADLGVQAANDLFSLVYYRHGAVEVYRNGAFAYSHVAAPRRTYYLHAPVYSAGQVALWLYFQPLSNARGVHYGLFGRLQPYERREAGKSSWAFRLDEWV